MTGPAQILARAEAELPAAEADLAALRKRVETLTAIRDGIALAWQRYGGVAPPVRASALTSAELARAQARHVARHAGERC